MMPLDLLKDGISWIAGKLGFEGFAEILDGFSSSKDPAIYKLRFAFFVFAILYASTKHRIPLSSKILPA